MDHPLPPYGIHIADADPRNHIRDYGRALTERAAELAGAVPGSVIVACSAALMHGLDVLPPGCTDTHWPVEAALSGKAWKPQFSGAVIHEQSVPERHVVSVNGVPVTTPEHILIDCVRRSARPQALAAADRLLRAGTDPSIVRSLLSDMSGRARIARTKQIMNMADPASESPGESWTRCLMIDAGFPRPECQVPVAGGEYRLDLGYPDLFQAVEYDGREHHGRDARDHDRMRRRLIADSGWNILVVRSDSILIHPDVFFRQLMRRMIDAGWSPDTGRLAMVRRRSDFICMQYRKARERRKLPLL